MIRAGSSVSQALEPATAAAEAVTQALAQAGLRRADAVLCFVGSKHAGAYPGVVRVIAERAGTRNVVGCSASGVIAGGREIESGAAVAVMALAGLDFQRLFVPNIKDRAEQAALELAAAVRPLRGRNNLLCLFPDTYNLAPERFLAVLERELPDVTMVGGGASEDGSSGETVVFCGDAVSSDAVAALLIAGDFELLTGVSVGCRLLGRALRVTAAHDNILLELEGRPALTVLEEIIGPLANDLRRAAAMVYLATALDPAARHLEHGGFLVRNLLGFDPQTKAIATASRPKPGDLVGFALRDAGGARDDLKLTLEGLQSASPPAFGLYFDCVARGSSLYAMADHDAAYIGRYFPGMPLAGFFSGFEIGPMRSRSQLLQYSGVLALVRASAS